MGRESKVRDPRRETALVVATETEMDRGCGLVGRSVVGATRAGLRPAPTGGLASRRWRMRGARQAGA